MKISDLRNAFEAGRPLVEQWLDIAEQFAALRDACREKEIDWQQVKTLLKATIQDAREGTDKRVKALLTKADTATTYAEELGLGRVEEKNNFSRETVSIAAGTAAPAQKPVQQEHIVPAPSSVRPSATAQAMQASAAMARSGGDAYSDLEPPAFLDRRRPQ